MPLPISRSEVGISGPIPYYPVRGTDGQVIAFAPRGRGRVRGVHGQARPEGGVPSVPRPPRSGERGRAHATMPTATRSVQHGPANVVPLVEPTRSAPTVLRVADLRAIIAGRRCLPGDEAAPPPRRSYAPRRQVVNITYTVMQGVSAPPDPPPDGPAAAQALGEQLASTAGRISAAATRVEESNPLFTRAELRAAARRGETVTQKQMQEAEKRHAMALSLIHI